MDEATAKPTATIPTSYWVIAGLGLVWNLFGAYLYTKVNLGDAALIAAAPPAMQHYMAAMPVWAHAGWAFGVWGSLTGSVLMVLRSAKASLAFAVSLGGAIISYGAQALAGVLTAAQPVVILLVIGFLWRYCRKSTAQGLMR